MIFEELIKAKYKISKNYYKKVFVNEDNSVFLSYFDIMNVYGLFPTPYQCNVTNSTEYDIKDILELIKVRESNKKNSDKLVKQNNIYLSMLKEKIEEITGDETSSDTCKTIDVAEKIRYFFSYEVIDYVVSKFSPEYVTTAWLKCYEALALFKLVNHDSKNINYFGICEQPGAFVFAINHYIKTNLKDCEFNFVLQSLKAIDNTIFRAEDALSREYKYNYDYGTTNTGDVTDINNIKYYRKKYYKKHFDLISADCGLDCSDDFSLQEKKLTKVLLGQLLVAISLANEGTNYFFKLFSMYESITCEIIFFASLLFEEVYLTRLLKTKITSGEIYCVCKGFLFSKEQMNELLEYLYEIYESNDVSELHLINLPESFVDKILSCNEYLLYSRLISYNYSYFRYNNLKYVGDEKNESVKNYINKLVKHYTKYFCEYYDIKVLDKKDKLVTKEYKSKWIKAVK